MSHLVEAGASWTEPTRTVKVSHSPSEWNPERTVDDRFQKSEPPGSPPCRKTVWNGETTECLESIAKCGVMWSVAAPLVFYNAWNKGVKSWMWKNMCKQNLFLLRLHVASCQWRCREPSSHLPKANWTELLRRPRFARPKRVIAWNINSFYGLRTPIDGKTHTRTSCHLERIFWKKYG